MTDLPGSISTHPEIRGQGSAATPIQLREHPEREATLWTPWRLWVTQTTVGRTWDVVVTQPALAAILDQVFRAGAEGVAGALGGRLFRCPSSQRQWVRVDSVWGSPRALPDACDAEALADALAPAPFDGAGSDLVRVGWYHSHSRLGATPTEAESRFHESQFARPWSFGIILLARSNPAGGVFQRGGAESLRRSQSMPFYELPSATRPDGSRQTLVHWQNHTTDSRVHLIDPDSLRALTPRISAPDSLIVPSIRPQRTRSATAGGVLKNGRARSWRRGLATVVAVTALLSSSWFVWTRFGSEDTSTGGSSEFASPVSPRVAFAERLADFDRTATTFLGLGAQAGISCDDLTPAYEEAEIAFLSVGRAHSSLGESERRLGPEGYQADGVRMQEIVQQFDASGCSRP